MNGGDPPRRFTHRRGHRKPANAFCCGRPSVFGNPFKVQVFGRAQAVALHRAWLDGETISPDVRTKAGLTLEALTAARAVVLRRLPQLRGLSLGCYCAQPAPGEPDLCHAAYLLDGAGKRAQGQQRPHGAPDLAIPLHCVRSQKRNRKRLLANAAMPEPERR